MCSEILNRPSTTSQATSVLERERGTKSISSIQLRISDLRNRLSQLEAHEGNMPGTIEQREQAKREIRARNQKDIFELPQELKVIGSTVKIFNVGPDRHLRSMGSYGQWTIHACEDGQPHSIATEVPYITNDPVHIDMFQMAHRHDSGRKVAADIIGVGPFHTPGEDLTQWGVFIAEGDEPT